jgi:hypothetical protein
VAIVPGCNIAVLLRPCDCGKRKFSSLILTAYGRWYNMTYVFHANVGKHAHLLLPW